MTLAEVFDAYHDNADYDVEDDVTKCKAFIVACRRLLSPALSPKRNVHGGRGAEEIELDLTVVQAQLAAAVDWHRDASAASEGDNVVHCDFNGFRE